MRDLQYRFPIPIVLVLVILLFDASVPLGSAHSLFSKNPSHLSSGLQRNLPSENDDWTRLLLILLEHADQVKDFLESIFDPRIRSLMESYVSHVSSSTNQTWIARGLFDRRPSAVDSSHYETWTIGVENADPKIGTHILLVETSSNGSVVESFSFPPDSPETCDGLSKEFGCTCSVLGHCIRGSLQVDAFTNAALRYQSHSLNKDTPLSLTEFVQAHNAYNTRADFYGIFDNLWGFIGRLFNPNDTIIIANHEFSLTDMFRMGLRTLELDPHWYNNDVRLCHSHFPNVPLLSKLLALLEDIVGHKIDWSVSNIACSPLDRPYWLAIQEIAAWLKDSSNSEEVISLYLENYEDSIFDHCDSLNGPLVQYFGDLLYTPADQLKQFGNNHTWPTIEQMLAMNKRIVVGTNDYNCGGTVIHAKMWREMGMDSFRPHGAYPTCGGFSPTEWSRVDADNLCYPPIMNDCGIDNPSRMNPSDVPSLTMCNIVWVAADQVCPSHTAAAVWSWSPSVSKSMTALSNVAVLGEDEHWIRWNESSPPAYSACRSENGLAWEIVSSSDLCPDGFSSAPPRNGRENHSLFLSSTPNQRSSGINLNAPSFVHP